MASVIEGRLFLLWVLLPFCFIFIFVGAEGFSIVKMGKGNPDTDALLLLLLLKFLTDLFEFWRNTVTLFFLVEELGEFSRELSKTDGNRGLLL